MAVRCRRLHGNYGPIRIVAMRLRLVLAIAAAFGVADAAIAREPLLTPPLDCDFGVDCFIPRFVDADPGRGVADFRCGPLTGDGHKGTDFALPSLAGMEAGAIVRPAAPGTVRATRDGEPDRIATPEALAESAGRECGNGVVVSHGDGWETQYCHLKSGSVAVEPGQRVTLATPLGEVGLSGETTFPHVHLSLRRNGEVVDPFAPDAHAECGEAGRTLWRDDIPYRPGGMIAAGVWDAVPEYDSVQAGQAAADTLPPDAPALVVWGYAFGGRAGDRMALSLDGPEGPLVDQSVELDRPQALYFRAVGRRRPEGGWPEGTYRGRAVLMRGEIVLESRDVTLVVAR